jgi:hypothetical protein
MAAFRELFASYFVDFDKEGELKKGEHGVEGLKHHLAELGGVIAGAFAVHELVHFTREIIDLADETREAAEAAGANAQKLQKLEYAFSTAGVGSEVLRSAVAKLNKSLSDGDVTKGAGKALKDLGLDLKSLKEGGADTVDIVEEIGIKIGGIEDPQRRAGIASEFFGKSYAKLLPLFTQGRAGIDQLKQEAQELGGVFDDTFLKQADEFNDNITALKFGVRGLAIQAIGPLLPELLRFAQGAKDVVKQIVVWARHTDILQNAGARLKTLGVVALTRAIPLLIAKVGGLGGALLKLRGFALRTLLPLLALEDFIVFLSGGKSLLGEGLEKAFGGDKTEGFRQALLALPGDVAKSLGQMQDGVTLFVAFVQDAFDGLWNFISDGWRSTGKILGALGFEDAQRRIEQSNFAQKRGGGHVAAEQTREGVRNIKAAHDEAEKKQGKSLSLEDFIPQGSYTPEQENAIRKGLGLTPKQTATERQSNVSDWRAAFASGGRGMSAEQYVAKNAPAGTSQADLDYLVKQLQPRTDADALRSSLGAFLPQGGAALISDEAAKQFGVTFAQSATAAMQATPAGAYMTPSGQPLTVQQQITVKNDVRNDISVAPGTDEEQARGLASSVTAGTRKALDSNELRAALVPTPGT